MIRTYLDTTKGFMLTLRITTALVKSKLSLGSHFWGRQLKCLGLDAECKMLRKRRVWPDVGIESSQILPKVAHNVSTSILLTKGCLSK